MKDQVYNPPKITMHPVESSQIAAVGHHPESQTLRVQFKPGKRNPEALGSVYDYFGVPDEIYKGFFEAESVGAYFHANVKMAGFDFVKLGVGDQPKGNRMGQKKQTYATREQWLEAAAQALDAQVAKAYGDALPPIKVSCGFPSTKALANRSRAIGECWKAEAGEGYATIFISPLLNDVVDVLATLVHEMIHAADNCENGHKGPFKRTMKKLGLEGKPTATIAGEALREELGQLAEKLGPYPHPGLKALPKVKKQGTRLLKLTCLKCGFIARATRGAVEDYGAPVHCEREMRLEERDEE